MRRGFILLFLSFSIMHLAEDMVWAFLARYTTVSFFILIGGILMWSLLTTIVLDKTPVKRFLFKNLNGRPHNHV